jgi:hypothetical protein
VAPPVQIAVGGGATFVDAEPGQLVQPGDVVRTGSGGIAVLTFFDGSESQLETDSQVQVEHAEYDPAPNIALAQTAGVTVNRVIPLPPGGNYETDTPTAIGLVRGTSFAITVAPANNDGTSDSSSDAAATTDPSQLITSAVLLTDRDGHVGHVQVLPSNSAAVVDLTSAGDVAATAGSDAVSAHLAADTLADLEQAARDLHDPASAQRVTAHARGVGRALGRLFGPADPTTPAATVSSDLSDAPVVITPAVPLPTKIDKDRDENDRDAAGASVSTNTAASSTAPQSSTPSSSTSGTPKQATTQSQRSTTSGSTNQGSSQSGQSSSGSQSGSSGSGSQSGSSGSGSQSSSSGSGSQSGSSASGSKTVATTPSKPPAVTSKTRGADDSQ